MDQWSRTSAMATAPSYRRRAGGARGRGLIRGHGHFFITRSSTISLRPVRPSVRPSPQDARDLVHQGIPCFLHNGDGSMFGLIGATLTVAATTIDDAIWLVPYTSPEKLSLTTRALNMAVFVGTLEVLAILCCLIAQGVISVIQDEWILGALGATLCWIIAAVLYIKKLLKKRQRALQVEQSQSYDSIPAQEQEPDEPLAFDPWTVMSMTCLGALDEISYFPALLVGHVFSGWELCVGTFLAACLILLVITTFLAPCRPLMEWLDGIPLYGIVAMFATVLTISVLVDLWTG